MIEPLALIHTAGAPGGISMACARALGVAGHRLGIAGPSGLIEVRRAELIAEGFDVTAFQGDLSDPATVARLFDRLGPVSVLINAADISAGPGGTDLTKDQRRRRLDMALTSAVLVTRAALPGMVAQQFGRIIMIGSEPQAGRCETAGLCETAESATDDPMFVLARILAQEVGLQGVTVNGVAPGWITNDTDLAARIAQLAEIAAWVRFLGTQNANDINGAMRLVDGPCPPQEHST